MQKLVAVEYARAIMTEAIAWPDWKWLFDKARVREAADRAAEAFEMANRQARSLWRELEGGDAERMQQAQGIAAEVTKEAEEMFAAAERQLNAGLAREAANRALQSFDLREQALEMARSLGRTSE